jgi:creatinine amidohydrolase/Fe(II)-dependent formamide hydrolase-like protein
MGAVELDRMTWPEVQAEQARGRDTVVIAFGATEQHGPHMPLATDTLLGDHLAHRALTDLSALFTIAQLGAEEHGVPRAPAPSTERATGRR